MVGAAAVLSLAFWRPLQNEKRSHIQHMTKSSARSVQADIAADLDSRMLAQVRLAKLWSLEEKLSRRDWESQARLFLAHQPGYLAVQWLDATYRVRWVVTEAEKGAYQNDLPAADDSLKRELEGLMKRGQAEAAFTPAFLLGNGITARRIIVPIYRRQTFLGFVTAVFDEEKAFEGILRDHAELGYAIVVFEGNHEIYRMPGSTPENEKQWSQDAELRLPGATWRIRVWPKRELLRETESALPAFALVMGSLIGLLLFMTLDFARTAYLKSKELRRVAGQLELRVQERTEELRSANKKLETEINERRQAESSLQELSGRLLQLRDEEQRRIARELHDSTAQILGALAINVEKVQQIVPDGQAKARKLLAESTELVERATAEVRTISYLLHPPLLDDLGLEGVLPWYANGFSNRSGIQVSVNVQANLGRFPHELELTVFRIVQEALTNIHRHSGSLTADITVLRDGHQVTVQITDHGRGIPLGTLEPVRNAIVILGVGIPGMRERVRQLGGQLEIGSDSKGTFIKAVLPVGGKEETSAEAVAV